LKSLINWLFLPFKFHCIKPYIKASNFKLLDVGCGNHSPTKTKRHFPSCRYFGVDKTLYNNDQFDLAAMEQFYQIDLEQPQTLSCIPDQEFDAIICSHVIDHVRQGSEVVRVLSQKLRIGGVFFIEYPSHRSLNLPSMKGTLNFSDDATHCQLYSIVDLCNILMSQGYRVQRAGMRRFWRRILILPIVLFKDRHAPAGAFWDICGFSDYIIARRVSSAVDEQVARATNSKSFRAGVVGRTFLLY
jgi:SAM-dependent methyltransferase